MSLKHLYDTDDLPISAKPCPLTLLQHMRTNMLLCCLLTGDKPADAIRGLGWDKGTILEQAHAMKYILECLRDYLPQETFEEEDDFDVDYYKDVSGINMNTIGEGMIEE